MPLLRDRLCGPCLMRGLICRLAKRLLNFWKQPSFRTQFEAVRRKPACAIPLTWAWDLWL